MAIYSLRVAEIDLVRRPLRVDPPEREPTVVAPHGVRRAHEVVAEPLRVEATCPADAGVGLDHERVRRRELPPERVAGEEPAVDGRSRSFAVATRRARGGWSLPSVATATGLYRRSLRRRRDAPGASGRVDAAAARTPVRVDAAAAPRRARGDRVSSRPAFRVVMRLLYQKRMSTGDFFGGGRSPWPMMDTPSRWSRSIMARAALDFGSWNQCVVACGRRARFPRMIRAAPVALPRFPRPIRVACPRRRRDYPRRRVAPVSDRRSTRELVPGRRFRRGAHRAITHVATSPRRRVAPVSTDVRPAIGPRTSFSARRVRSAARAQNQVLHDRRPRLRDGPRGRLRRGAAR